MNKSLTTSEFNHRRNLMKFIAGSPLLYLGMPMCSQTDAGTQEKKGCEFIGDIINDPSQAINVFDFQKAAEAILPPAHYGYLATGVLDDQTLHENEKAYRRIKLRMRRLISTTNVDTSIKLFGETWPSPIVIAPCGNQMAFHPEGEVATAKAAKTENHLQILSTVSNYSIQDVIQARGTHVWYQLYPAVNLDDTLTMVERAEAAGCPVLVITVDMDHTNRRETLRKMIPLDDRECSSCHGAGIEGHTRRKPMLNNLSEQFRYHRSITWEMIDRIRESTNMKVVIKGIVSGLDATIALDHGVDGLIVSNHGGRSGESGRATIESLPEVLSAVHGEIPVMVDGGIRRGGDIFKALALGARAVGVGRPYLWGLGSFGQAGVETVLKILKAEFKLAMQQTGVTSIGEINESLLT